MEVQREGSTALVGHGQRPHDLYVAPTFTLPGGKAFEVTGGPLLFTWELPRTGLLLTVFVVRTVVKRPQLFTTTSDFIERVS